MIHDVFSIKFGILSTEDILKMSVCKVDNTKLIGPNSVYDERMGPISGDTLCQTCGQTYEKCSGHFGHIELNMNIIHPLFYKYVVWFLKCFCDNCYRFILPEDYLMLHKLDKLRLDIKFEQIQKIVDKIDMCSHCKKIHPKIIHSTSDNNIIKSYKQRESKTNINIVMTIEEVKRIFDNISNDDINFLGFDSNFSHPKNLIISVLPVIPHCSRPSISADGNTCDDDLTNQLCEIVKVNNQLATETSEVKIQKALQSLKFRIHTMYDNSKGRSKHTTSGRPIKGIKERLTSKDGLIRSNLSGKRCNQSARTVIGPDPSLKLDELGIPNEVADILTYPEIVNRYNIDFLTNIVNSGGANTILTKSGTSINLKFYLNKFGTKLLYGDKIIKANSGNIITVSDRKTTILEPGDKIERNGVILSDIEYKSSKKYKLEIGDVVYSKLRNGMVCLLNRQPTLHKGSMMAVKIKRLPGKSFRFNLSICKSFNADFDGDEMNIHTPTNPECVAELQELCMVKNNIITPQSSKPNIMIVQDSLLAAYKMTYDHSSIPRETFFQMIAFLPSDGILKKIQHITNVLKELKLDSNPFTGHGLFSVLLPNDLFYNAKNNTNAQEPIVKIYKGVMYEGTLSKENLGSSHNSLIVFLYKEYKINIVSDFIDNVQFLGHNYLLVKGFTVGISDCIATKTDQIEDSIEKCFIEAINIKETVSNPHIREMKITACLSKAKDIGMKIAKDALTPENNFISTVASGSKGDYFNIAQLTGLLGQQNLGGKRIPNMLNHGKRSLPHYSLKKMTIDMEFESRGFIKSSFVNGLNPKEFYFHAASGREGVCDTAMGTSKTGYIQRKMIKCMEDLQIKYDGTVRNVSGSVYQQSYGDNGYDMSHVVRVGKDLDCCNVERIVEKLNMKYK